MDVAAQTLPAGARVADEETSNARRIAIIVGIGVVALLVLFAVTKLASGSSNSTTTTPRHAAVVTPAPAVTTPSTLAPTGSTRNPFSLP